MRRGTAWLGLYVVALVVMSLLQDPRWLALGALAVVLSTGRRMGALVRRAALATSLFTGLVSLAWLVASIQAGTIPWEALVRLNLRAFALTLLTLSVAARLDFEALTAGAPRLQMLFVLIRAQIAVYRRLLADFRLAARSRMHRRPAVRDGLRLGAAAGATFLRRAEHSAEELTQGMTSRGFFLDPSGETEPRP